MASSEISQAKMKQEVACVGASSSSSSRETSPSAPLQQHVGNQESTDRPTTPVCGGVPVSTDSVKEEGLTAFRNGDWRGATDAWSRGLRTLDYILAKEDEFDEQKRREFVAMQQSYLLNLSLSTLKEGRWAACIVYCDKALKNDPTALKALYRKAQAQQELGEFDAALATVDRYLHAAPGSPLALSLQSQLRHQKAAHAVREKKLLQGMFRNLEHDPRSEAPSGGVPPAAAARVKTGLLKSVGSRLKGWFSGDTCKSSCEAGEHEQSMPQQDEQQRLQQELWTERLAALNQALGSEVGQSPCNAAGRSAGNGDTAEIQKQQAALKEALAALRGSQGGDSSAIGSGMDLEQIAQLVQMHQKLASGRATFKDKFLFGLRLAWFGVRQFCSSLCQYLCRRRQTRAQHPRENGSTADDCVLEQPAVVASKRSVPLESHDGKAFVSRSQRRERHRTAAAAAARRRMQKQGTATDCSSRFEDMDEVEERRT